MPPTLLDEYWAKMLGEIATLGIDMGRETDVDYYFHLFTASDAKRWLTR